MDSPPPAIEIAGLTKVYGETRAVDGLSCAVLGNRITALVGRNGAGKSTTLKILLGMISPTAGSAHVLGLAVTDPRASLEIRRRVAYVAEDKGLYAYMTVGELIQFTRGFYSDWDATRAEALRARYELPARRRVKALSKGMRTKLALLLALARRPQLLILDEPTEGLDPVSIEELLQDLVRLAADGTTIVFSSHHLAEVERIADDVIMVERGKCVLAASLDELRAYYRLVHLGFVEPPTAGALHMPGVYAVHASGRQLAVHVSANVEAVVQRARDLGATSVQVSNPSLREIFLERVAP